MKPRKILIILLVFATLICSAVSIFADASFGSGVNAIAKESEIIKTATKGSKVIFSELDIKQSLLITDFDEITITSIPKSSDGTLMFAGRRAYEGMVIKRKNIPALVFVPQSKEISECSFTFTTPSYANGANVKFTLKFIEKVNYEPEIDESISTITTQREIGIYGKMTASDKESDELEYMIIKYPKDGRINVLDEKTGEFVYTPPIDYVGEASFTYVAKDIYGNYSTPSSITINVTERMSEVVYSDMKNHRDYSAAVALTALGAVDGKLIGGGVYFMPDETVTKAEFITMALKCAGVSIDIGNTDVYFDDADDIPTPMLPYIAKATSLGAVYGSFKNGELLLNPNEAITKYEAAMIISALTEDIDEYVSLTFTDKDSFPQYAKDAIYKMCSLGIFENDRDTIEGNKTLTKAECVRYLYNMI